MIAVGAGRRILVVDDDEIVLEAMSLILESYGFDVVSALSGEKALTLMDSSFHAVLTDLNMGVLTGNDVAIAAKSIRESMFVVLCYSPGGRAVPDEDVHDKIVHKPVNVVRDILPVLCF
jgi:CheY-like chemotaxis protein